MKLLSSSLLMIMTVVLVGLTGCQSGPKKIKGLEITPEQRAAYRADLEQAWTSFGYGDFEISFKAFSDFRKKHPKTIFDTEARFGEARSLEEMEEWTLALNIYNEIVDERMTSHPELAALAMFYRSRPLEALGDESKMLATLKGAEEMAASLPEEIKLSALPARLATVYFKLGQLEEAKKYLALAQKGVEELAAKQISLAKLAQLSFEMGISSANQLSNENFQAHLDSFQHSQLSLLRSIEAGVSPWSDRALAAMQDQYLQLWNLAMNPPVPQGLDAGARDRQKIELRGRWTGEIARLVTTLKNNLRLSELSETRQESQLREFITAIEKEIRTVLSDPKNAMPLTPESERLRNPIRMSRPKKSQPSPVIEAESPRPDPNLKYGDTQ